MTTGKSWSILINDAKRIYTTDTGDIETQPQGWRRATYNPAWLMEYGIIYRPPWYLREAVEA